MGGWGEKKTGPNGGAGTTGEIEIAHQALDRLSIPGGVLAERVLVLVARVDRATTVLESMVDGT